jgi:hypothetical protein
MAGFGNVSGVVRDTANNTRCTARWWSTANKFVQAELHAAIRRGGHAPPTLRPFQFLGERRP